MVERQAWPEFPEWLNRDVRPIPSDLASSVSYFSYEMADVLRRDPSAIDRVVVEAETDSLHVTLDNFEFRVTPPNEKLFGLGMRHWKDGVEGVSSQINSRAKGHAEPAYNTLLNKAME